MCSHNNIGTYCPSCHREKEKMRYANQMGRSYTQQMGECPPGFSQVDIFGIKGPCYPNSDTLVNAAATGASAGINQVTATGVQATPGLADQMIAAVGSVAGENTALWLRHNGKYLLMGVAALAVGYVVYKKTR